MKLPVRIVALVLTAALPGCMVGCQNMTPEERAAWSKFAMESAAAYRDAKLLPKPKKVEAQK